MPNKLPYKISSKARKDLQNIFEYISDVLLNPSAAIKLMDEFDSVFDHISYFPECCPLIENKNVKSDGLRKIMVKKYIAFYRISDNAIQIVRVLYGMSNYYKHL